MATIFEAAIGSAADGGLGAGTGSTLPDNAGACGADEVTFGAGFTVFAKVGGGLVALASATAGDFDSQPTLVVIAKSNEQAVSGTIRSVKRIGFSSEVSTCLLVAGNHAPGPNSCENSKRDVVQEENQSMPEQT